MFYTINETGVNSETVLSTCHFYSIGSIIIQMFVISMCNLRLPKAASAVNYYFLLKSIYKSRPQKKKKLFRYEAKAAIDKVTFVFE